MTYIILENGELVKVRPGQDPDRLRAQLESRSPIREGVYATGLHRYEIYIDGQCVDVDYGSLLTANELYADWKAVLSDDPEVGEYVNTSIDEIPDGYWKNGHQEPLRLEDAPIPFDDEPVEPPEPLTEADSYGLEPVF
jgi:hypothetical protein